MRYTPYSFSKNWGIPLFYSFCAFIGEIVVYNDSASGIPRFDYFKIEVYTDAFLLLVVYLELTEVRYTTYLIICFWGIPQCWKVLRNQNLPKCTPDLCEIVPRFSSKPRPLKVYLDCSSNCTTIFCSLWAFFLWRTRGIPRHFLVVYVVYSCQGSSRD